MKESMKRRDFIQTGLSAAALAGLSLNAKRSAAASGDRKIVKSLKLSMVAKEDADGNALTVAQRLQIAKDAGFASAEPDTMFDPAEVEATRAGARKAGIGLDAIICSTHWKYPLSDPDPAVAAKTMEGMRISMRNAKAIGADMVLLVPAVVKPDVMYRDCWTRSIPKIKELGRDAEAMGLTIGIENVWNKFLLSPLEAKAFIAEIGSPNVKFWFDVGNIVLYGYPQDWIRTLGRENIGRVDVKGFDAGNRKFVPLREGSIDWPEVMRAFDEIGYEGVFAAEVRGGDLDYLTNIVSKPMDLIIARK